MSFEIAAEMPEIVRKYALYYRNIKGRSQKTVNEYCMDLRTFFRFMKRFRGLVPDDTPLEEIPVQDIDLDFIRSITTLDIFEFMNFVADERSNMSSTRQRKSSSLKSFFGYLSVHEGLLETNPTENLTPPKKAKTLPRFLSLEQSIELLNAVEGVDKERDYCILTLFLNCGMRLSELVSINMSDVIHNNSSLRIVGKGNKERMVYLNDACLAAIEDYVRVRPKDGIKDRNALFLSNRGTRISPKTVQAMVNKYLEKIGLGGAGYSVHKLRHTAATLMYRHGHVDIRVLQDILGHENLGTTEIYTHTSSTQMEDAVHANPLANIHAKKETKQ
ncbi:tyrosine recombinase XerC [Anaeromassilibacillus senegalensis]|uniref:Tyrosine recombinase XerC n=1 Tax=Anaeromassilibacillus senegalensis TaxID=1673717 RepID=A0ABS9CNY7_9FIRM|nr:tyrosine recombinase XerC [Anaeromassilibacillus senegalensis]MCF2651649.1 tyrosine recombinase XerC [Anaeromassilibacillus senegalensis]